MSSLQVLRTAVFGLGLCAVLASAGTAAAAEPPAAMVADINTTVSYGTDNWAWEAEFVELGGTVLFTVDDGIHGTELWKSDGSPAGTSLVKDLCPGYCSSYARNLTVLGSEVLFSADDGSHGRELWKSDGTSSGTVLVADIVPGLTGSSVGSLAAFGGVVLFSAFDATLGRELWRSDGTAAGTTLVKDIEPGPGSSVPIPWREVGGYLLLTAMDSVHGRELWRTDGTEAGTALVKDINSTGSSEFGQEPIPGFVPFAELADGVLLFAADDGELGRELWRTDGTEVGTVLVSDVDPGWSGSYPDRMTTFNGEAYFSARDVDHGTELWKSDGTEAGTVRVADIYPGSIGSGPSELTVAGSELYFVASDDVHGRELWQTDGTEAETSLVKDIWPGPDDGMAALITGLTAIGSTVVFLADDGVTGIEPWRSDGTEAETSLLVDVNPGPGGSNWILSTVSYDRRVVAVGRWFFRAMRPDDGFEVWVTDGTTPGTQELPINDQTSSFEVQIFGALFGPRHLSDYRGSVLFQAGEVPWDQELWRSDGSEAGTGRVADLAPGPDGSFPIGMKTVRERSLFGTSAASQGPGLWLTDGSVPGTELIAGGLGGDLTCAATLAGDLYFSGSTSSGSFAALWRTDGSVGGTDLVSTDGPDAQTGCVRLGNEVFYVSNGELWKSNGTPDGTQRVIDIWPGFSSDPDPLTVAGPNLFFSAFDDVAGRELWVSDGTGPNTHRVKDILPGPESGILPVYEWWMQGDSPFAAVGDRVFFAADDGVAGSELWVSDGTEAGTHLVADVFPGPRSSEIRWLTAVGGRVFFVADDGVHGRELWTSDGTAGGTLLFDLQPGPGSSLPQQLAAFGTVLLFSADDGVHGREPWRADDSFVPTVALVQDLAPGALPSSPLSFTASGAFVYCAATDGTHGFELWRLRISPFTLFADDFESGDTSAWPGTAP